MKTASKQIFSLSRSQTDIRIPVSETVVACGLCFGQDKVGEPEHCRHVLFVAVVMAWNSQQISGTPFWIVQPGKYEIPVTVVSVEKKTVVSIPPSSGNC